MNFTEQEIPETESPPQRRHYPQGEWLPKNMPDSQYGELYLKGSHALSLMECMAFFIAKSLVLVADYEQIVREATRLAGGEQECLKVGFLRCYSGQEFHLALEEFVGRYPDIPVEVFYGNHDELYHMLMENAIDLAFNDQRRAFSDKFMNMLLVSSVTHVEIAGRNPMASLDKVTVQELKNIPCIREIIAPFGKKKMPGELQKNLPEFEKESLKCKDYINHTRELYSAELFKNRFKP